MIGHEHGEIKAIIFDLDGTLYQDHFSHHIFIEQLTINTKWHAYVEQLTKSVDEILCGKHGFKLGHAYHHDEKDGSYDTVEELLQFNGQVNDREGASVNHIFPEAWYSSPYKYAGDAWGIGGVLAYRMGISIEKQNEAFQATRKQILLQAVKLERYDKLAAVLKELKHHLVRTMIVTNAPQDTAEQFISLLELHDATHDIVYDANKPYGLEQLLPAWLKQHGIKGQQVLAIGDHGFNDLATVKRYLGKTALISPLHIEDNVSWDYRMHTLEELYELLSQLNNPPGSLSARTKK